MWPFFRRKKSCILKCNFCGNGEYSQFKELSANLYECSACGRTVDIGFSNDENSLLEAAHSDLKRQEFDIAEEKFRDIIQRFPKNHEAYWGLVCAKYGIKYEEDFDGRWIPTYCLDAITTFDDDSDYQKALDYSPSDTRRWYKSQAEYVARISKKWQEEASKEKPYDIFICFKDSDGEHGITQTQDSIDATNLNAWLVNKGYSVFFSRVSLADKIGEKYEPFIFHALKTAKVMLIFSSKEEYINSVWMKNEWHRFTKSIERGEKRQNSIVLINNGMNINALPGILKRNQCLDFTSFSFSADLQSYLNTFFKKSTAVPPTSIQSESPAPAARLKPKTFGKLHEHDYSITHVIPASCIARGYTVHECACGESYNDSFTPLADHKFKLKSSTPATCTEDGKEVYACEVCGDSETKTTPALGHSYSRWVEKKRATCEQAGLEARRCEKCGHEDTRTLTAKGHAFTPWTKSKDGKSETRYCTNCGKDETRAVAQTTITAQGKPFTRNGKEILFGQYPQSEVNDVTLKRQLNALAGTLPTASNSYNWTSYGYYSGNGNSGSQSQSDYMWYQDVTYSNEKYRGVYFINYRPYYTYYSSSADNSKQDDNGYTTNTVYWFKYEPIKWRILEENEGYATVLAELILDSQDYNYTDSSRTIDGKTVYGNNYANSSIRAWLNDTFYNTAFNELQKALIQTVEVDNSARSTNPDNNATCDNYGNNSYACANTQDKVWLLSEQEVTRESYGFATEPYTYDTVRRKQTTAYAQCQGAYTRNDGDEYDGNGWWWLRSPYCDDDGGARGVLFDGGSHAYGYVYDSNGGVVAALKIKIS